MDLKRSPPSDCEVRAIIKFLTAENVSASQIYARLCNVFNQNHIMSLRSVQKWRKQFLEGRTDIHDEARAGRPSDTIEETVRCVRALLEEDRRHTITDLHHEIETHFLHETSRTTIHRALVEHIGMRKVCARWVPRELTEQHRKNRMGAALELLSSYHELGDDYLQRIVTGDETWVHYWTPETKKQSSVWKLPEEPAPKKFKERPSAGKIMATVFWDYRGVILVEYTPPGTTVTKDTYFDTLVRLKEAIRRKRPGLLTRGVILLHDNARPHVAGNIKWLLEDLKWIVFGHPPYSPDLAPSDYYLFPGLKNHLGGRHFATGDELRAAVDEFFAKMDAQWYAAGIDRLVLRYDKCLNQNGDYVEK